MAKEKLKISSSLRSIFDNWFLYEFIFSRRDNFKSQTSIFLANKSNKGFTLIEVLITTALIGIFSVGFMAVLDPAKRIQAARDSERKSDLKQIQAALELYRADQGDYPNRVPNCDNGSLVSGGCASPASVYMSSVPEDPKLNNNYIYCNSSTCGAPPFGYALYACIENDDDSDSTASPPSGVSGVNCPSGYRYLQVKSP
jgi:general secretion pathway protein G